MATMPTSRFVPRARARLDWSGDPLARYRGNTTAPQGRAGLAYNKRLYSPGSAEMRALTPAAPAYPTGWQGPARAVRPGLYTSQYGTASLRSDSESMRTAVRAPLVLDEYTTNLSRQMQQQEAPYAGGGPLPNQYDNYGQGYLETFTDSSVNPAIPNPNLPMLADANVVNPGPALGTQATGEGAASAFPAEVPGSITRDPETPENARQPEDNPLENLGRDTSVEAQSQRYYDRKFSRNSKDPIVKMQARRIDGRAPNVSRSPNPARFNNEVAGHSNWLAY